jgi:peptidoglycan/LPS O-acetylase OafA/YrhL
MLRSILSIVLGYVAMAVATMVATVLLCLAFGIPLNLSGSMLKVPAGFNIALLGASALCAALGGFIAASVARRSRRLHAIVLAAIVLVLGVAYAMFKKNGPEPEWYLAALPVVGAVAVAGGGVLKGTVS